MLDSRAYRFGQPGSTPDHFQLTAELLLDQSGYVIDANEFASVLFDYHPGELIGTRVAILIPRLTHQALSDSLQYRRISYLSHCGALFNAYRRNGSNFPCRMTLNRLGDDLNPLIRVLLVNAAGDESAAICL